MDASFWALVALVIFIGIIVYVKVPATIAKSLDDRAVRIRNELEEARRLREEAQQLLAEYQRKRKEAEREAGEIVSAARREADVLAAEAKQKTEDYVTRRTAMAEQKIAQAEADAIAQVRSRAVEVAIGAAEKLIAEKLDGGTRDALFTKSLGDIKARLN